ncbi:TMEM175 family protein [Microbacterium sp. CJ88]|uniref:TMEM175 family protein n=1 Tax=Microbacterium sp. CJ88 TaxID=3445672 RepID=UPI003F65B144
MTDAGARAEAEAEELRTYSAERAKAFIDAVVAIAMTLLILPLMEGVTAAADADKGAAAWVQEHQGQLISFVLSFVIIAMFWMNHHRLFAVVERVTTGLLWITMAWLLSIVWLPVATAMSGR